MKKLFMSISVAACCMAGAARAEFVCGLNPQGDNFLSLREGPDSSFPEITRMGPGTALLVRSQNGAWLYVQIVGDNLAGWAYSRYVCQ